MFNILKFLRPKQVDLHYTYDQLREFFFNSKIQDPHLRTVIKDHINACNECWKIWNKIRWDRAEGSLGLQELSEYLGEKFIKYYDSSWALANEWNAKERKQRKDIEEFYQNTNNYVYNSLIFYESGDRDDLKPIIMDLLNRFSIKSVTDFGCGIGNDGLFILSQGQYVNFVDFRSPSTDFLNWRLKSRNISSKKCSFQDVGSTPTGSEIPTEMLWSVDAIEHMYDPFQLFNFIKDTTRVVALYIDSSDNAGGRHPFHFPDNEKKVVEMLEKIGFELIESDKVQLWVRE